jgi:uncharacterized protein YjiS (DUF1127 family)
MSVVRPQATLTGLFYQRVPGRRAARRSLLIRLFDRLIVWQERADERARLSEMPEPMLRDLGLSRADLAREIEKPFWRP